MEDQNEKQGIDFLSEAETLLNKYGRDFGGFRKYSFPKFYGKYMSKDASINTILFMPDMEVYLYIVFDETLSTCVKYKDFHPVGVIDAISRSLSIESGKEAYANETEEYKKKLIKIIESMIPIDNIYVPTLYKGRRGCVSSVSNLGFGIELKWLDDDDLNYEPEDRVRLSDIPISGLQEIIRQTK